MFVLYLIIIVIIFLLLGYYYKNNYKNLYDSSNNKIIGNVNNFDNIVELNSEMLELIALANQNAKKIIQKENFLVDERLIKESDANNYLYSLNNIQLWLNNTMYGNNGILAKIKVNLNKANNIRVEEKQKILELLTNIFIIQYINYINKHNAQSYNIYSKYKNPESNKFLKQYTN